eukprot:Gb_17151 [translate_table: standard]
MILYLLKDKGPLNSKGKLVLKVDYWRVCAASTVPLKHSEPENLQIECGSMAMHKSSSTTICHKTYRVALRDFLRYDGCHKTSRVLSRFVSHVAEFAFLTFIRAYREGRVLSGREGRGGCKDVLTGSFCTGVFFRIYTLQRRAGLRKNSLVSFVAASRGKKLRSDGSHGENGNVAPMHTKAAYIVGFRVSPTHRYEYERVERFERWFSDNGVECAYMATEKDNEACIKLFAEKCNYNKWRLCTETIWAPENFFSKILTSYFKTSCLWAPGLRYHEGKSGLQMEGVPQILGRFSASGTVMRSSSKGHIGSQVFVCCDHALLRQSIPLAQDSINSRRFPSVWAACRGNGSAEIDE